MQEDHGCILYLTAVYPAVFFMGYTVLESSQRSLQTPAIWGLVSPGLEIWRKKNEKAKLSQQRRTGYQDQFDGFLSSLAGYERFGTPQFTVGEQGTLDWEGKHRDLDALFTQLAPFLDDATSTWQLDEAFNETFLPHFKRWVLSSSVFYRLGDKSPIIQDREKKHGSILSEHQQAAIDSPATHIVKVFEVLDTTGLDSEQRTIVRWMVFFHDLLKVVNPLQKGHGVGAALLVRTYFEYANARTKYSSNQPKYSQEFIGMLEFLCTHHHIFEHLMTLFTDRVNYFESVGALDPASRHKNIESIQKLRDLSQAFNEPGADVEDLLALCREVHFSILDVSEVLTTFPEIEKNPELLSLLWKFTQADVGSNPAYQDKYAPRNRAMHYALLERIPLYNERERS